LLHQTFSCFSIRQKKHCGNCYACLVRKYSSIAANYKEANDSYVKNMLTKNMRDMSDKDKDFYEAIISYLLIINNKYDFNANLNISYIPRSFFVDYKKLLKNFSLDMIIGMSEAINSVPYNTLNVLGKYSHNEISKLDQGQLNLRREELLSI
jgi:hypothetical protein